MCVLAHVLEAHGIATVALVSIRSVAEAMRPPRALHGEFPLGRPLGRPGDPDLQHDVLARALALLEAPQGPVLVDHPEVIVADEEPLACSLPPRYDPDLPPAVDEARGLRAAYERARIARGATAVGRVVGPDGVADVLDALDRIAAGGRWPDEVALPGDDPVAAVHDVRAFYEEAALELADGPPPGGRGTEAWFFERTEAGRTVLAARAALAAADAPFPVWFYMAPGHR